MLFWHFFRGSPNDWICRIYKGRVQAQGLGLSFYFIPGYSNVVSVTTAAVTTDFHFEERSNDYQTIHVQGVLTWRITEPEKAAKLLDFTVDAQNRHLSEDPKKLEEKLQYLAAVLGRRSLQNLKLEAALKAADTLGESIRANLATEGYLASIGISVLTVEVLSLKPEPEVGRALEAATRESLLKQSDDATAQRRLAALENELAINEREAGNQLAKERAARSVTETREAHARLEQQHQIQMAGEKQGAELSRRRRETESTQLENLEDARNVVARDEIRMQGAIDLTGKETLLADSRLEVARKDAEAEKARTAVLFDCLRSLSAEQLQSLALMGAKPGLTIANAFQRIAERAGTIGQLNITPDLLQSLLQASAAGGETAEPPATKPGAGR
jgi:hypothetical protein